VDFNLQATHFFQPIMIIVFQNIKHIKFSTRNSLTILTDIFQVDEHVTECTFSTWYWHLL